MMRSQRPIRILSHRACLDGPDPIAENTLGGLRRAQSLGFDLEFDVNLDPDTQQLVLTHDPAPWSPERDAAAWLAAPAEDALHALNIKHLGTVAALGGLLRAVGTQDQFFWFDFELLSEDRASCLRLMRSLTDGGLPVAYRVSEREQHFEEYLRAAHVSMLWLDEFSHSWVTPAHLRALSGAGKVAYFVSPDLHGCRDMDSLKRRWEPLVEAGVSGICTDYPLQLAHFLDPRHPEGEA